MKKSYLILLAVALAISSLLFQGMAVAGAPLSGAIFTGLEDGGQVNANHYADKRDVYLNAGPPPNAPQDSAGLPDGNYYFQVTDPSGKKLLSEDPVKCREFRVKGGVFWEYVSKNETYMNGNGKKAKVVPCYMDGWQHGKHDTGFSIDHNSLTIQLMPYKNTPNRGGVYKAWATPIEFFEGDLVIVAPDIVHVVGIAVAEEEETVCLGHLPYLRLVHLPAMHVVLNLDPLHIINDVGV